eukprot:gene14673-31202_t
MISSLYSTAGSVTALAVDSSLPVPSESTTFHAGTRVIATTVPVLSLSLGPTGLIIVDLVSSAAAGRYPLRMQPCLSSGV